MDLFAPEDAVHILVPRLHPARVWTLGMGGPSFMFPSSPVQKERES